MTGHTIVINNGFHLVRKSNSTVVSQFALGQSLFRAPSSIHLRIISFCAAVRGDFGGGGMKSSSDPFTARYTALAEGLKGTTCARIVE